MLEMLVQAMATIPTELDTLGRLLNHITTTDRGSTQCLGTSNLMRLSQQHQEVEAQILLDTRQIQAARTARWTVLPPCLPRRNLGRAMDSMDSALTRKSSPLEPTCKNSTLPMGQMVHSVKEMVIQTKVLPQYREKR